MFQQFVLSRRLALAIEEDGISFNCAYLQVELITLDNEPEQLSCNTWGMVDPGYTYKFG